MRFSSFFAKILLGVITLYFLVSEVNYITNLPQERLYDMLMHDSFLFLIISLKFVLIVVILPIVYLFKLIAYWIGSSDWISSSSGFGSSDSRFDLFKFSSSGFGFDLFQTELFYKTAWGIIFVLIVLRIIEQVFS